MLTMLTISYKMQRCKGECENLIDKLEQLTYVLEESKAPYVRLNETVGRIAQELSDGQKETVKGRRKGKDYVTLDTDVNNIIKHLRMVCSGEISIDEAQKMTEQAIRELETIKYGITAMEEAIKGEGEPKS